MSNKKTKEIREETMEKRQTKVRIANEGIPPSRTPGQRLGEEGDSLISFEHMNIHGIISHDEFVELTNTMGTLEAMEAGIYSTVENQWDTTSPSFNKYIKETIKKKDKNA